MLHVSPRVQDSVTKGFSAQRRRPGDPRSLDIVEGKPGARFTEVPVGSEGKETSSTYRELPQAVTDVT